MSDFLDRSREQRSSRRRFRLFLDAWRSGELQKAAARSGGGRGGRFGGPGGGPGLGGGRARGGGDTAPATPVDRHRRRTHLRRYWRWLRPYRGGIVLVLVLGMVMAGFDALWPLATGWMIDVAAPGSGKPLPEFLHDLSGTHALVLLAGWSVVVIIVGRLIGLWRGYLTNVLGARLTQHLRRELFDRLLHLPLTDLHEMKTGGVVSRLSGDVDGTTGLVQMAVISPATAILRLSVVVAVLLWIDWRLTAVALGLLAICGAIYHRFVAKVRPVWRIQRQQRGEIDGRLAEVFGGIRVVRAFAREKREELAYAVGHHTVMRESIWTHLRMNLLFFFWEILMPAVSLAIIGLGGWFVLEGRLRIGEVVTMQILSFQVLGPVLQIVRSVTDTQRGLASMDRVYEVLDKNPEMPDRADAIPAPVRVDTVHFEHVWFAYDQPQAAKSGNEPTWVLRDITLTVPGGSTVALVGASGAGKTTFTNLVARFEDPHHGRVLLDDRDLRDYRLASYRSRLGFVQQEVFLFDGTIGENIAYGQRDASRDEIVAAARAANAWEFIAPLDGGLDAVVGERGVKLSGGQRQRLAIARAMLADPAILILDEATSNLDTESERLIQESLDRLLTGRTTFVIAHRLNTIRHADTIVVLEAGRIVETGSHEQLMLADGIYAEMVRLQSQEMGVMPGGRAP